MNDPVLAIGSSSVGCILGRRQQIPISYQIETLPLADGRVKQVPYIRLVDPYLLTQDRKQLERPHYLQNQEPVSYTHLTLPTNREV